MRTEWRNNFRSHNHLIHYQISCLLPSIVTSGELLQDNAQFSFYRCFDIKEILFFWPCFGQLSRHEFQEKAQRGDEDQSF